jgi:hypothetical protein
MYYFFPTINIDLGRSIPRENILFMCRFNKER